MDLLYQHNKCFIKFYYTDVNKYEQLSLVTCCFHIARNKNRFSLYNGSQEEVRMENSFIRFKLLQ